MKENTYTRWFAKNIQKGLLITTEMKTGRSFGVVANVLDCDILVNGIELKLHNFVYFRTNIIRKIINPFFPLWWGYIALL